MQRGKHHAFGRLMERSRSPPPHSLPHLDRLDPLSTATKHYGTEGKVQKHGVVICAAAFKLLFSETVF